MKGLRMNSRDFRLMVDCLLDDKNKPTVSFKGVPQEGSKNFGNK
jgi:hypothetical protein